MSDMKTRILNLKLTDDQIGLFFLGQVGFIIKFRGKYIMMDGFLSGKTRKETGAFWGREFEAPIAPEDLDFIDFVTCSHDHMDHLDVNTLKLVAKVNQKAKYIAAAPLKSRMLSCGISEDSFLPAYDGVMMDFDGIPVQPIASAHEELHTDENGNYCEMGFKLTLGNTTIYHAGDCVIYDGLQEKIGKADICMLPVNGRTFFKLRDNIIGNMTLEEAVQLAKKADAKLFLPLHFDMFATNTIPTSSIPAAVELYAKGMPYHIFTAGEKYIYAND